MRCPRCVENGTRSKVYVALRGGPFWDEDGVFHSRLIEPQTYRCSAGHRFTKKEAVE